eukprot:8619170-Lingulodinium_polyedra.AAC.1
MALRCYARHRWAFWALCFRGSVLTTHGLGVSVFDAPCQMFKRRPRVLLAYPGVFIPTARDLAHGSNVAQEHHR